MVLVVPSLFHMALHYIRNDSYLIIRRAKEKR